MRVPVATYRLQFNGNFTFAHATEILDYLEYLGVSDVYASPLFEAGPRSAHGYDVCCFGQMNPALGGLDGFNVFSDALKERGMGVLLDVVPNHMSATTGNSWWRDVLEHGRSSKYAAFFDIDWDSPHPGTQNKVLLPVLEDHYGKVLESGKLRLVFEQGKFFVAYHEQKFPVDGATLSSENTWDVRKILETHNGTVGDARSFDRLDALIRRQHYRLAYWRVAAEQINYRRFFDVTELVGLRMELPEVFHATHEFVLQLLRDGRVSGVRVDHPDGLRNPREYLDWLRSESGGIYVVAEKILSETEALPADWAVAGTTGYDFLNRTNGLFVDAANARVFDEIYREFIAEEVRFAEAAYRGKLEVLDRSFRGDVDALARKLQTVASRTRSGGDFTFSELRGGVREVIANFPVYRTYVEDAACAVSAADVAVVREAVGEAKGLVKDCSAIDFLGRVLTLEIAGELEKSDLGLLTEFVSKFQQLTGPAAAKGIEDTAFYRFNRLISLNEVGGEPDQFGMEVEEFHRANEMMAKCWPHSLLATATHDTKRGEDVRARINVLSEMPEEWRAAVRRWSRWNADKQSRVADGLAPSGNDEYLFYQILVGAWVERREDLGPRCPGASSPRPSLPSLMEERESGGREARGREVMGKGAGLFEGFRERIAKFMVKAVKEAKVCTSWTEPNAAYEDAVRMFVERTLGDANGFVADFEKFQRRVAFFGRVNSLAQTLLKMSCPGVPDFYQGGELWDLSLVDPDNRRAVDFAARRELLARLKNFAMGEDGVEEFFSRLLSDEVPGAMKLFLIWRVLNFRREQREVFAEGAYVPLPAWGHARAHVCAFARTHAKRTVVVIVPRLVLTLTGGAEVLPLGREVWKDTAIQLPGLDAAGAWENILTGERVAEVRRAQGRFLEMAEVLKVFPVALLVRKESV